MLAAAAHVAAQAVLRAPRLVVASAVTCKAKYVAYLTYFSS
jgi:hypothetical protein